MKHRIAASSPRRGAPQFVSAASSTEVHHFGNLPVLNQGDPAEVEADEMAASVVGSDREATARRRDVSRTPVKVAADSPVVANSTADRIESVVNSGGQPLDPSARAFMEPRFGHSFSDVARKVVSIINLASVRAIENMVGAPVHPLRFRANLYVEGWPAWHEFDLVDYRLAIGDVRLKVVKRIVRCAAVNVDPDTAQRDLAIPQALQRRLGHADCGIYAEVIEGGSIGAGDTIAAEQPELL